MLTVIFTVAVSCLHNIAIVAESFECGKLVVIRESESDLTIDEKEEADITTLED